MINRQRTGRFMAVLAFLGLAASGMSGQQQEPKQEIPDAPSASRPAQPFPATPPASGTSRPETPPANEEPPSEANPAKPNDPPRSTPATPPPFKITTVREGGVTQTAPGSEADLFKIVTTVNQVIVPVMVKNDTGHLIDGLLPKDFSVYENGVKQKMNFFTSDPIPLSAAVILDFSMPDIAIQKVNKTFGSLEGAFSQFDEVSVYTYSSSVTKLSGFDQAGKKLTAVLNEMKTVRGRNDGPPVMTGPLGPQGPMVNGVPLDQTAPIVYNPPKESHVLNDALLAAALDLSKRERTRRKIIFIITDGREYGSKASYRDTLKVLLSQGIQVYGVGVEGAAIPGYDKLAKIHIPKMGYTDILPRYSNATGGEILTEFSTDAIELAYTRAIGDARNQYTVGYLTRATPSGTYREIEVRIARPDVKVYARDGYYPLPPTR